MDSKERTYLVTVREVKEGQTESDVAIPLKQEAKFKSWCAKVINTCKSVLKKLDYIVFEWNDKDPATDAIKRLTVGMANYLKNLMIVFVIGFLGLPIYSTYVARPMTGLEIFVAIVLAGFCFYFARLAHAVSKGIKGESNRDYVLAFFSALTSLAALIIAMIALFSSINS